MSRPCCLRRIAAEPPRPVFQPAGIPTAGLPEVALTLDEFEAIRLVDLLGQYQDQAAAQMNVSRPTAGRVLVRARRKIADALVHGKILRIEGGCVERCSGDVPVCPHCRFRLPAGGPADSECPRCRRQGSGRTRP
jgi:predicted DNA-binding protein (UPF0251 family)